MITSLACVLTALLSPVPVTMEVSAASLAEVVKQIAEATGTDLRVARNLAEQRIGVRFKAVPLDTVKEKLAYALGAEWQPDGEGVRLVLKPVAGGDDAWYKESIRAYFEAMPARTPFTRQDAEDLVRDALAAHAEMIGEESDWERIQAVDDRTPGVIRNREVLRALGPRALSELKEGQTVVFSSAPTRLQRALPPAVLQVLERSAQEMSMYAETVQRLVPPGSNSRPSYIRALAAGGQGPTPDRRVGTVLVTLERGGGGVRMVLAEYDEEGNLMSSAFAFVSGPRAGRVGRRNVLEPKGVVYEPSETIRSIRAVRRARGVVGDGGAFGATPEDLARVETVLKDLVKHEPLAWGFGDFWLQTARAYDLNSVGVFPDGLADPGMFGAIRAADLGTMVTEFTDWFPDSLENKDGWLTMKRGTAAWGPMIELPRREVSAFVRQTLAAGGVTLDALAVLAGTSANDDELQMTLDLPAVLWPSIPSILGDDMSLLRLYGRLDRETRRRARGLEGVTLRYGHLSSRARTVVDAMLFKQDWEGVLSATAPDFDTEDFERGGGGSLALEPTVAFAGGVPPDASVSLRVRDRGVIFARRPRGSRLYGWPEVVTADQIALALTLTEAPWYSASESQGSFPYDRFATGTMEQLEMLGTFGEGRFLSARFQLSAIPADDNWVAFDGLPEEVRKEISAQMEELRKEYKRMRESGQTFGRRGGGRPPVP